MTPPLSHTGSGTPMASVDPELNLSPQLRDRVRRLTTRMRQESAGGTEANDESCAAPFMIITPLGQLELTDLLACLRETAINYHRLRWLEFWSKRATRIYLKRALELSAVVRAIAYEDLWREKFPCDRAIVCELQSRDDYARLLAAKRQLRSRFPSMVAQVTLEYFEINTRLHAFHVPDEEDWRDEARLLSSS